MLTPGTKAGVDFLLKMFSVPNSSYFLWEFIPEVGVGQVFCLLIYVLSGSNRYLGDMLSRASFSVSSPEKMAKLQKLLSYSLEAELKGLK